MGNVGDRDIQHKTLGGAPRVDRVIEVTRIGSVNRDQWQIAQVAALGVFGRAYFGRDGLRFVQ